MSSPPGLPRVGFFFGGHRVFVGLHSRSFPGGLRGNLGLLLRNRQGATDQTELDVIVANRQV